MIIPVRLTFKGAPGNVGGCLVVMNYVWMLLYLKTIWMYVWPKLYIGSNKLFWIWIWNLTIACGLWLLCRQTIHMPNIGRYHNPCTLSCGEQLWNCLYPSVCLFVCHRSRLLRDSVAIWRIRFTFGTNTTHEMTTCRAPFLSQKFKGHTGCLHLRYWLLVAKGCHEY